MKSLSSPVVAQLSWADSDHKDKEITFMLFKNQGKNSDTNTGIQQM